MFSLLTLFLAQAPPPAMPDIKWPISPLLIVAPLIGLALFCLGLVLLGWYFKWPWLIAVAELLMPGDNDERPRWRRRHPQHRDW